MGSCRWEVASSLQKVPPPWGEILLRGGWILWWVLIPGFQTPYSPVRHLVGLRLLSNMCRPKSTAQLGYLSFTIYSDTVALKCHEPPVKGLRADRVWPKIGVFSRTSASLSRSHHGDLGALLQQWGPETWGVFSPEPAPFGAMMGTHPWWSPLLPLLSLTPSSICKSSSMHSEFSRSLMQIAGHRLTSGAGSRGKEENKGQGNEFP